MLCFPFVSSSSSSTSPSCSLAALENVRTSFKNWPSSSARTILTLPCQDGMSSRSHHYYHHHPHPHHHQPIISNFRLLVGLFIFCAVCLDRTCSVVVTQVHVLSIPTGRSDYVLEGESVQMSCHYLLEGAERVEVVTWKKDGEVVYLATAAHRRPMALGLFKHHVDYNTADLLNTVTLFNVSLEFAGEYSCRVATGRGESENTASMTIIVDACRDSDWKTKTDMVNCVEEISFHCVGMYPKPSPACSIHDDKTDQYVAGETFDMMEPLPNGTYEIAIQRRYSVANFSDHIGELSFHCHLVVLMTTWKMGLKFKLFGEVGCLQPPPTLDNGTHYFRGERTCWKTPKENSRVTYMCMPGFELVGPSVLVCRNGTWTPDPIHLMSQPVSELSSLKLRTPYCTQRNLSSSHHASEPKSMSFMLLCLSLLLTYHHRHLLLLL